MARILAAVITAFAFAWATQSSEAALARPAYHQDVGGDIVFLNVEVPTGVKVVRTPAAYFLPTQSGVATLNADGTSFRVFPFEDSATRDISGIENAGTTLWIVSRDGRIQTFSPLRMDYGETFKIHNSTAFGINGNLHPFWDRFRDAIWFSSFLNVDRYDVRTAQWQNLSDQFRTTEIGEPSSYHLIAIEPDGVWIGGAAHWKSTGGLLHCTPPDWRCTAYISQILGTAATKRLDIEDLLVAPEFVWVLSSPVNGVYAQVSEFNKKSKQWSVYNGGRLEEATSHIARFTGRITPSGPPRIIATIEAANEVAQEFLQHPNPQFERPFLEELRKQAPAAIANLSSSDGWKAIEECPSAFSEGLSTCGKWIVTSDGGALRRLAEIPIEQVSYEKLLVCATDGAILQTSRGIAHLDVNLATLTVLDGSDRVFYPNTDFKILQTYAGTVLAQYPECEDCETEPKNVFALVDPVSNTAKPLTSLDESAATPLQPPDVCPLPDGRSLRLSPLGISVRHR